MLIEVKLFKKVIIKAVENLRSQGQPKPPQKWSVKIFIIFFGLISWDLVRLWVGPRNLWDLGWLWWDPNPNPGHYLFLFVSSYAVGLILLIRLQLSAQNSDQILLLLNLTRRRRWYQSRRPAKKGKSPTVRKRNVENVGRSSRST